MLPVSASAVRRKPVEEEAKQRDLQIHLPLFFSDRLETEEEKPFEIPKQSGLSQRAGGGAGGERKTDNKQTRRGRKGRKEVRRTTAVSRIHLRSDQHLLDLKEARREREKELWRDGKTGSRYQLIAAAC